MHIILVSNRLATAKTLVVTRRMLALGLFVVICLLLGTSFLFSYASVAFRLPFVQSLVVAVQQNEAQKTQVFVRDNLNAMAGRLGEMQAQLLQLDALGERISSLSGIKLGERPLDAKPVPGGQGGPFVPPGADQALSGEELQRELDRLASLVEHRADTLSVLESRLMDQRIRNSLLPTIVPVKDVRIGSTFGVRADPMLSVSAMHEGIDFVVSPGTEVVSAAGGIVVTAEMHPQYGNMIDIDHGNGFSSRYAHLSSMRVKAGQLVKRGQSIAASGNTGRSTGPHLHFEVRYNGVAQNPARFLQQNGQQSPLLAAQQAASPARSAAPRR